jgi:hypothetical protein
VAPARARYDRRLAQAPVQPGAGHWCREIDADATTIMAVLVVQTDTQVGLYFSNNTQNTFALLCSETGLH